MEIATMEDARMTSLGDLETIAALDRCRYWDERYKRYGQIYGATPSEAAVASSHMVRTDYHVLELGGGYGRNSGAFRSNCQRYEILDSSPTAINMAHVLAKDFGTDWLVPRCGDIFDAHWGTPNVVFSNFVLHLFLQQERLRIFELAMEALRTGGLFVNSFVSTADVDFGRGQEVEQGTFLNGDNQPRHFFNQRELQDIHRYFGLEILTLKEGFEREWIADSYHNTSFLFVVAKRAVAKNSGLRELQ